MLRDLDFTPDRHVLVQRLKWLDPKRNEYEKEMPFDAYIENNTDLSRFRLTDEIGFPKTADGSLNFDPLSNVAYRVVVARQPQPDRILVALPYCFIGLFALACVGLLVDLRRRQPPPVGLMETYQAHGRGLPSPLAGQGNRGRPDRLVRSRLHGRGGQGDPSRGLLPR